METGCFMWDKNSIFNICYMEFVLLRIKADGPIFLLPATHGNINIIPHKVLLKTCETTV